MRNHRHLVVAALVFVASVAACQKSPSNGKPAAGSGSSAIADKSVSTGSGSSTGSAAMAPAAPVKPPKDIDSKDILARTETSPVVQVKHVLIGWKDLSGVYGPRMDARAKNRTNDDAAKLAQDVYAKLKANPDLIDQLSKDTSEDPGSASGDPYEVKADGPFDVIFCDLMMPVISGADFYRELAVLAPDMLERLVFMTGGVFSTQTNEFLGSVPNTCIEKPFDIGALLALINDRVR